MRKIIIPILENSNKEEIKRYIKHLLKKSNRLFYIKKEYLDEPILNSLNLGIINSLLINYGVKHCSSSEDKKLLKTEISKIDSIKKIKFLFDNLSYDEIIQLCFIKINIEIIYNFYEKIVDLSFEDAKYIVPNNPLDCKNDSKKNIISLINSILFLLDNNEPKDIIYLISYIFKSVLVGHNLVNGNKRLASMILFNFLYIFAGLSIKTITTQSKIQFWETNVEKFIKFINKYHQISKCDNFHIEDEKLLEKIYEWIYDNIQIILNFT